MLRKAEIGAIAVVVCTFAIGFAVYPQLPDNYASHWNLAGEIDGYLPKSWGLFLIPAVMGVLVAILSLVPRFDRFPENVRSFRSYYDGLLVLICLFLLAIDLQSILWNLGWQIKPNTTFPVLFGILWFYLGILLEKTKRNDFCGIRTPWTMQSDTVWNKTHCLGGRLFKVAGAIAILGLFFQPMSLLFIVLPILGITMYLFWYSYRESKQEKRNNV